MRSIGTVASANRIQKSVPMMAMNAASPNTGCVRTPSSRSVNRSCARVDAVSDDTAAAMASAH